MLGESGKIVLRLRNWIQTLPVPYLRSVPPRKKRGRATKTGGKREGESLQAFFEMPQSTSWKTICRVKMCSCRRVSHARHVSLTLRSTSHVINVSIDVNCQNRSTNHRVYQELVNRNKILKTMLTSSSSLSLPSPRGFRNFSRSAFPTILELSSKRRSRDCSSSNTV